MDTEKYIELTRRCCQKYGGIDAKGDYHGCESKTCPLKGLECGDFMSGDYNPLGEASEICQRTELALRKEFPDGSRMSWNRHVIVSRCCTTCGSCIPSART